MKFLLSLITGVRVQGTPVPPIPTRRTVLPPTKVTFEQWVTEMKVSRLWGMDLDWKEQNRTNLNRA
jgi:hypothetical protein